jgi:hypothetical protein
MKNVANYTIQAPNATAVNLLRSWLTAVGIQSKPGSGDGIDLVVIGPEGETTVQVALGAPGSAAAAVTVPAKHLTGKNMNRALDAFYSVTDRAGYDRRQPLNRGDGPELNEQGNPRKLHYRDEDFLVSIRHTEFRRAPNPEEGKWEQYRVTMEKCSWAFLKSNSTLCARHGLEIGDLLQYARCYVVNFCARYETPTPKFFDNERKCYSYLRQRFNSDLRSTLLKKERSMMPDAETVRLGLFNSLAADPEVSPNPESMYAQVIDEGMDSLLEVDDVDQDYVDRNCELDLSTPASRRASASVMLDKLLNEIPHDTMLSMLDEAKRNNNFDFTTRKEAGRRMNRHKNLCRVCTPKPERAPRTQALNQLPQASRLQLVRELVRLLHTGTTDNKGLAASIGFQERQVAYYKDAATQIGLLDGVNVTGLGIRLLESEAGSKSEAQIFRDGITASPTLSGLLWFFTDPTKTVQDLIAFVIENYKMAESTAKTRCQRLGKWRELAWA